MRGLPPTRCMPSTTHEIPPRPAVPRFLARFEADVDPDGRLDPEERRRRAEHARSAYFARLALASVSARRARRASVTGGDTT